MISDSYIRNWTKFAKALPKIMQKALDIQLPFRDKFLKNNNLTFNEFISLSVEERNCIQEKWKKSKEYKEVILKFK